jgi:hypothetical protein
MKAHSEPYPEAAHKMDLFWHEGIQGVCTPMELRWLRWKASQSTGNILEIGTYLGTTTRELALQCPDRLVYTVDWWNPGAQHLSERQRKEMLRPDQVGIQARDLPNVLFHDGDSSQFSYTGKDIGFVFIDGDHSSGGVLRDTDLAIGAFKAYRNPMTIVWHDYGEGGHWPSVTQALDESPLSITHVMNTWIAYLDLIPGMEPIPSNTLR